MSLPTSLASPCLWWGRRFPVMRLAAASQSLRGFISAVVYVFNPYFLSLISPRGALAEMLGLAVAPILFLVIYRTTKAPGWRTYLATSLTGALLILTHPLSAFLFAPFILAFGGVALASAARAQRKRALVAPICAAFTAALLSCFYWLPSQTELGGIRTFDFPAVPARFSGRPQALSANPALRLVWRRRTWLPSSDLLLRAACPRLAVRGLLYRRLETTRRGGGGLVPLVLASTLGAFLLMSHYAAPLWQTVQQAVVSAVPLPLVWPRGALLRADYRGRLGSGRRWSDLGGWCRIADRSACWCCTWRRLKFIGSSIPLMLRRRHPQITAADIGDSGLLAFEHDVAYGQATKENCWIWAYEYLPSTSSLSDCHRFVDTMLNDTPTRSQMPPTASDLPGPQCRRGGPSGGAGFVARAVGAFTPAAFLDSGLVCNY